MARRAVSPCFLFLMILFCFSEISHAIMVTGSAYCQNLTNNAGIKVVFVRTAPSSLRDSTLTAANGSYSLSIETGVYNIVFFRDGYFSRTLKDIALYTNQGIENVTLIPAKTLIRVPADFSTIQSAIDAARSADTVLVSPGRYLENINFKGKNIVVGSLYLTTGDTAYVSQTIIDGNQTTYVVEFSNNETETSQIVGFIWNRLRNLTILGIFADT